MSEPSPPGPDGPTTGGPAAEPHCYRHPDREAHIRCTRCGRPICPDCMVSAPVGFQCPDCVHEAARSTQQGRTLSGGQIHRDPVLVTKVLVGLNVAVFALQYMTSDRITRDYAMWGYGVAGNGEWYRLITSAFLHASITHLAFNMLALWVVGGVVEPRLGRWRYLTVYLLSALAGSVLSYAVDPASQVSVGASGAVFGLFGAFAVLAFRLRLDVAAILGIIAINVVIGFVPAFNINWRAHFGGLIAGTLLTAVMVYTPQRWRTVASVGAAALVLLTCVGATVWRTDQIRACLEQPQLVQQCQSIFPG